MRIQPHTKYALGVLLKIGLTLAVVIAAGVYSTHLG